MTLAQVKAVDDELNRLAFLVELRQHVRARREALTAYTLMSARRITQLKQALTDAEARVEEFVGTPAQYAKAADLCERIVAQEKRS